MSSVRLPIELAARYFAWRRAAARFSGAILAAAFLVGSASAQAPPGDRFAQSDAAGLAVSRQELLELVDTTAELATAFGLDDAVAGRLSESRSLIESATPDDLAAFGRIAPQVRQLRELLAQADAILHAPARGVRPESAGFPSAEDPNYNWNFFIASQSADLDDAGGASDADTDSESRNGNCSFANRKTTQEMFALLNGTAIAEVVQQVASRICDQVIVVLGGGNASIVCVITDVIFDVVKAIQDNIFLCEDTLDGAEASASYQRLGHLHTDLQNAETNLAADVEAARVDINTTVIQAAADQITAVNNAATTVVNAVNERVAEVLSAVQTSQDLFLRIEIEKALHSGYHYAALYLPEAHGGHLGLVRQIVAETIAAVQASGDPANGSPARFAAAEAEYAAHHWKKAYTIYAESYFEAIKVLGETRN